MNIVWATDDNYVLLTGVSMVSVFEKNKEVEIIRVWILANNISEEKKNNLEICAAKYNREIFILEINEYLDKIKNIGALGWGKNESFAAYSRLFIAEILNEYHVDKVLYCDCDLIINGSLNELWNMDLNGKTVGMVREYNRVEIRDLLDLPRTAGYYQSGLLLIDINAWRKRRCTERIIEHMRLVSSKYPFIDQDLINCTLYDEIFTLPIQYNVNPRAMQYSYRELVYIWFK